MTDSIDREVPDSLIRRFRPRKSRYALVIPVINENGRLITQLQNIAEAKLNLDVIVADGGSTDGSTDPEVLEPLGVATLLTKKGPGGLSAQLRMAFSFCLAESYEGVVTMDGNGKDDIGLTVNVVRSLGEGYDFVQGSRFLRGGYCKNTPPVRYIGLRMIHAPLTSLASGRWFTDTTNGLRGYSRSLLANEQMSIFRRIFDTYELLAYVPIRASRLGLKIAEVPVGREYPPSGKTPTKIKGLRGNFVLFRILLAAVVGAYNPVENQCHPRDSRS